MVRLERLFEKELSAKDLSGTPAGSANYISDYSCATCFIAKNMNCLVKTPHLGTCQATPEMLWFPTFRYV